ncbi:MAG: FAD synthase [Metamycoplasmataceae bacterium]
MEIYTFNYKDKNNNIFSNKSSLILGKFNVFHKGHEELLERAKKLSSKNKIGITLFDQDDQEEILPIQSKLNNLAEIGFDFVILIKFNFSFKSLNAKDFINYIVEKYNVENFIVGKDFRFGFNRMWGSIDLQEYFKNTYICDIKKINNIKISSSSFVEMIKTGEIKLINELLTSKYNPIISYQNPKFIWDKKIIKPHSGIYFIKMEIEDYWYHGILHISMGDESKIFLLNYEDNFIDNYYVIQILEEHRIIISSRFDSIIEDDKKKCLEFFHNIQKNNI